MPQENPLCPVTVRFPKLEADLRTEVLIVGGGMAGICCAHFLEKAGFRTAVIEAGEVGCGASGASSGILFHGTGVNLVDAHKLYGRADAELLWGETTDSIQQIEALIEKESIPCFYRKPGAVMVAANESEAAPFEPESAALAAVGVSSRIIPGGEIKRYYALKDFHSGLAIDSVSQIVPAVFAANLATAHNLPVYENTSMRSFAEEKGGGVTVQTEGGQTIRANKLVVATNFKPFFGLEKHFNIESSSILASQPVPESTLKRAFPTEKFIWTSDELYDILYPQLGRLVLEVYRFKGAERKFQEYYPALELKVDVVWGNSWSKTKDWIPIIGSVRPDISAAIAMGDQGVVMGFTAGRKMASVLRGMTGDDRFLQLAAPTRLMQFA